MKSGKTCPVIKLSDVVLDDSVYKPTVNSL